MNESIRILKDLTVANLSILSQNLSGEDEENSWQKRISSKRKFYEHKLKVVSGS